MDENDKMLNISRELDILPPCEWSTLRKEKWKEGEQKAFEVYKDGDKRLEGDKFFSNYFLGIDDPVIHAFALMDSLVNTSYYEFGELIAFSSLFLCDFRECKMDWHGLNIAGSIGIITRKTFSLRSSKLISGHLGIPLIREDNLMFIKKALDMFPKGTKFSVCAHFQPESLVLIKNLLRLGRIKILTGLLPQITKFDAVIRFLPSTLLDTLEIQEKDDGLGTSYLVCSFTN